MSRPRSPRCGGFVTPDSLRSLSNHGRPCCSTIEPQLHVRRLGIVGAHLLTGCVPVQFLLLSKYSVDYANNLEVTHLCENVSLIRAESDPMSSSPHETFYREARSLSLTFARLRMDVGFRPQ